MRGTPVRPATGAYPGSRPSLIRRESGSIPASRAAGVRVCRRARARELRCHVAGVDAPARGGEAHPARADAPVKSSNGVEQVDWRRQWYAVRPVADLSVDRPIGDQILGKEIVIWRDGQGEWRVFEDRCPHRKVALSEGRVEQDGTLACAYHGWRFNGSGTCMAIPQLEGTPDQLKRVCSRPAACAVHFPTTVHSGILFVWMEAGPGADGEAARCPVPGGEHAGLHMLTPWYARDMQMSVEVLMENVVDPSHVAFSHHGIDGNREAPPLFKFGQVERAGVRGFRVLPRNEPGARQTVINVHFPSLVAHKNSLGPLGYLWLLVYTTPLTATTARVTVSAATTSPLTRTHLPLLNRPPPIWFRHLINNAVFDGDAVFLSRQAHQLAAGVVSHESYYTPAPCDVPVVELWKFLRRHCTGTAATDAGFYPHQPAAPQPRRAVLDRWTQHTATCHACRGAFWNIQKARRLAGAAAAAGAVALWAMGVVRGLQAGGLWTWLLAAGVVVCGVAAWQLKRLEARFVFTDYVHAEKD